MNVSLISVPLEESWGRSGDVWSAADRVCGGPADGRTGLREVGRRRGREDSAGTGFQLRLPQLLPDGHRRQPDPALLVQAAVGVHACHAR